MSAVLVVAKAPVPGLAKTRLAETVGDEAAAAIAAASLLDTLRAAAATGGPVVVALTGELANATRRTEVEALLAGAVIIDQRGDTFGDRLAAAHTDAHATAGPPVFQVGMDTPQLTGDLLVSALDAARAHDAVLGMASDGGWWGLAVAHPSLAQVLVDIPMSTDETGECTGAALERAGARVHLLTELADVDTWDDAQQVAAQATGTEFARAVATVSRRVGT